MNQELQCLKAQAVVGVHQELLLLSVRGSHRDFSETPPHPPPPLVPWHRWQDDVGPEITASKHHPQKEG